MLRLATLLVISALAPAGCTCGSGASPTERASSDGGSLTVGTPTKGTFAPGLRTDDLGKAYVDYTLRIEKAGRFKISLTSTNTGVYDPYLRLLQAGEEVDHDDDGAADPLQAMLVRDLEAGTYTVRVTKFGLQPVTEAVPFTLAVEAEEPLPEEPPPPTPLALGTPATATFGTRLPVDGEGRPYVDFTLAVAEPGVYRIDLRSADTRAYDPLVRLFHGGAEVAHDDDGGDAILQARLERELQTGEYVVRATRFAAGQLTVAVEFTLGVTRVAAELDR